MPGIRPWSPYRGPMLLIRRTAVAAALAIGAGALGLGVAAPAGARTAQVFRVPPNGAFTLRGHGWGHGHGMSQYGAYGAAKVRGMTYQQIVGFYYPHTSLDSQPLSTTVRVLLHGTSSSRLVVAPRGAAKLTASTDVDGVPDCVLPDSVDGGKTSVAQWRARKVSRPDGDQLRLEASSDGTTWVTDPTIDGCDPAWSKPLDGSITFDGGGVTNLVRPSGIAAYRGKLRAAFTGTRIYVVDVVPLDSYLLSVVPSEMPASWSPAALQAQAVAARTYASYEIAHPKNKPYYDVYDDTRDQVYGGKAHEAATTTAAVKATEDANNHTADVLVDGQGNPAFTQFSSSDGGWTVSGGQPYLPAQHDPYDGLVPSSVHSWATTVSVAAIQKVYGNRIGTLRSLAVTGRDGHGQWGGRITTLTMQGTSGSVDVTGSDFRFAFGLRSEWFQVILPPGQPTDVTGGVSSGTATIGWQPPATQSNVAAVSGYRIVLHPGGSSTRVANDARTATLSGLKAGVDYTASVAALSNSGPGRSTTVTTKVHRLGGGARLATSVAASAATFPDGKARGAVLVRQQGARVDAFAAAPLARAVHGPVLLTGRASLPSATADELKRVLPAGGTVYLLGSTSVIRDPVRAALHNLGYHVARRAGDTPAAVARSVAHTIAKTATVSRVFEVDVSDQSLAWVAGAAAARMHSVVLLTATGSLAPETARWLAANKTVKRFAVGAAAAAADPSATALTGANPAAVAVAVASRFFSAPPAADVVSAGAPVAGIAAAARLAVLHGPLLYADGSAVSASTASYLSGVRNALLRVDLIGSELPYDDVEAGVQSALLGR
jgi:stage II sporulation protein D